MTNLAGNSHIYRNSQPPAQVHPVSQVYYSHPYGPNNSPFQSRPGEQTIPRSSYHQPSRGNIVTNGSGMHDPRVSIHEGSPNTSPINRPVEHISQPVHNQINHSNVIVNSPTQGSPSVRQSYPAAQSNYPCVHQYHDATPVHPLDSRPVTYTSGPSINENKPNGGLNSRRSEELYRLPGYQGFTKNIEFIDNNKEERYYSPLEKDNTKDKAMDDPVEAYYSQPGYSNISPQDYDRDKGRDLASSSDKLHLTS